MGGKASRWESDGYASFAFRAGLARLVEHHKSRVLTLVQTFAFTASTAAR